VSPVLKTNEYLGFVVSDLGSDETLERAAGLAPALRNALEGSAGAEKSAVPALLRAHLIRPGHVRGHKAFRGKRAGNHPWVRAQSGSS